MKKLLSVVIVALLANMLATAHATAQQLEGNLDHSSKWKSGWIDLQAITDFNKGDTLIIEIGGPAKKILVRLLSNGDDPNTPSGIEGKARTVPADHVIKVVLKSKHRQVKQISVHGGPRPFDIPLGEENGPATLISVERISRAH